MAYLKMLRQYPVGRWALYQVVLTAIALMLKRGVFDVIIWSGGNSSRRQKGDLYWSRTSYEVFGYDFSEYPEFVHKSLRFIGIDSSWLLPTPVGLIWLAVFITPVLYVWKKPFKGLAKQITSSLNELATESFLPNWNYQRSVVLLLSLITIFSAWIAINLELLIFDYGAYNFIRTIEFDR